jgi:hypothetical protein
MTNEIYGVNRVLAISGGVKLWNTHEHKAAELLRLQAENRGAEAILTLLDCFTTDASKTNATGATQDSEDFSTYILSGKIRFERTLVSGATISLGPSELKGLKFLGAGYARAPTTADLPVVVTYKMS